MGTAAYGGKGQGKAKGRGEGRLGHGGRGRSKGGERQMGTTADGGKGSKGRAANGDWPVGAASCRREQHTHGVMPTPPPPPPRLEMPSGCIMPLRSVCPPSIAYPWYSALIGYQGDAGICPSLQVHRWHEDAPSTLPLD